MDAIKGYLSSVVSIIPRITITNIIEIIIIAFLVYMILAWIKNSRSWNLLKGLIVIFIFVIFCAVLRLDTILWILGKAATIAVMALIVIFQPELRHALEQLGSNSIVKNLFTGQNEQTGFTEKTANEIVKAAFEMSKVKTGALIVIENKDSLKEIERTGIEIGGKVTSQLLINIFEKNTPLHDGAVVIRGNVITAATCYLPLSDNMSISKALGTRHRAAIGMSEINDSITVVVSEETGAVSVAERGEIRRIENAGQLREELAKLTTKTSDSHRLRVKRTLTEDAEAERNSDKEHRS